MSQTKEIIIAPEKSGIKINKGCELAIDKNLIAIAKEGCSYIAKDGKDARKYLEKVGFKFEEKK